MYRITHDNYTVEIETPHIYIDNLTMAPPLTSDV